MDSKVIPEEVIKEQPPKKPLISLLPLILSVVVLVLFFAGRLLVPVFFKPKADVAPPEPSPNCRLTVNIAGPSVTPTATSSVSPTVTPIPPSCKNFSIRDSTTQKGFINPISWTRGANTGLAAMFYRKKNTDNTWGNWIHLNTSLANGYSNYTAPSEEGVYEISLNVFDADCNDKLTCVNYSGSGRLYPVSGCPTDGSNALIAGAPYSSCQNSCRGTFTVVAQAPSPTPGSGGNVGLCGQCTGSGQCQSGLGCWPCGSATLSKCAVSSCNECITPTPTPLTCTGRCYASSANCETNCGHSCTLMNQLNAAQRSDCWVGSYRCCQ